MAVVAKSNGCKWERRWRWLGFARQWLWLAMTGDGWKWLVLADSIIVAVRSLFCGVFGVGWVGSVGDGLLLKADYLSLLPFPSIMSSLVETRREELIPDL